MHRSVAIDRNPALAKLYFYPQNLPNLAAKDWPNFYIFMTSTRTRSQEEREVTGEKLRVQDGLIITEYTLRKDVPDNFEFMKDLMDIKELIFQESDSFAA